MVKPRTAKFIIWSALAIAFLVTLVAVLPMFVCVGIPTRQRIAEFTGGDLTVTLCPEHNRPYHFVLGVPGKARACPGFSGSLQITLPDGTLRTFAVASSTAEPCNWIDGFDMSGYIFAWHEPQCFSDLLHRGADYRLRFAFSEPIPVGCSLWFCSIKHASLLALR